MERVVVTGIGVFAPGGVGRDAFWRAAVEGVRPRAVVTRFATDDLPHRHCAPLPADALDGVPESVRFRYERHAQYAWLAGQQAWCDAELDGASRERMGVAMGTAHGPIAWVEDHLLSLEAPWVDAISAYASPRLSLNTAASVVALSLGLGGPQTGVTTACAAGLSAVQVACDHLRQGRADVMFAGGSEAAITKVCFSAYGKIGAMTDGVYRPFDVGRDGFLMGEGAVVLVLERWDHARQRGARWLAEVLGAGAACDGNHQTRMSDEGRGYHLAMRQALAGASGPPDLINAHGSGTALNDLAEAAAIRRLFRAEVPVVQSTKALTGHMMGAAGAAEAALSVLQIHHGLELPTWGCRTVDPGCDVPVRTERCIERPIERVLCNAAGFGGPVASVLFAAPL